MRFEAFERLKYPPDAYGAAFLINAIISPQWSLVSETFEIASLKSLPVILGTIESELLHLSKKWLYTHLEDTLRFQILQTASFCRL